MSWRLWTRSVPALFAAVLVVSGCNKIEDKSAKSKDKGSAVAAKKDGKHDDWWCAEHGIPEDECSMCSKKVADACKAKGDWCKEHERAKSQCFICDPKLKEVFAAKYRAKYGKEPPPIEEEAPKKSDSKEEKKDEKKDDKK